MVCRKSEMQPYRLRRRAVREISDNCCASGLSLHGSPTSLCAIFLKMRIYDFRRTDDMQGSTPRMAVCFFALDVHTKLRQPKRSVSRQGPGRRSWQGKRSLATSSYVSYVTTIDTGIINASRQPKRPEGQCISSLHLLRFLHLPLLSFSTLISFHLSLDLVQNLILTLLSAV